MSRFGITNYKFIRRFDKEHLPNKHLAKFSLTKPSEISVFLKHMFAMKLISNTHFRYNLIIEDDAIFGENFSEILLKSLSQLPKYYDMYFVGSGCNLHMPSEFIQDGKFVYKKCLEPTSWGGDGATRCSDSYFVSTNCANNVWNKFKSLPAGQINLPLDWWLNKYAREASLAIFWLEPTIVSQGSETGLFKSAIRG